MPKVLSYTPEWLSRPNAGYKLFAPTTAPAALSPSAEHTLSGTRKTIATRGSEIFVAVGNTIRWADLTSLRENPQAPYRALKVFTPLPITRLTISPDGTYLAVSTSHTVHVVVLPDSAHLDSDDTSTLKVKTFQVGPTAHVREESTVVSVLWHPLGYHGRCLVTVTLEGVVRLWEINRSDRSTFSDPALSIDLKKLANAANDEEDLSASKYGAPKGFSPDSFELEVASACFGDFPEQEDVHGWAPLTLWIAMVEGDLYALCPLLPSKWQLDESTGSSTFLQTLATSINIKYADTKDNADATRDENETADKQLSWLSDILYQEPFTEDLPNGDTIKVFTRPNSVPACPLLQGPFLIGPEVDEFELSDIIVFSLKTFSKGTEDESAEGLPAAVICLLTDTCQVHVCLDLEGVVGQWLPSSSVDEITWPQASAHTLAIVETIALTNDETSSYNQSITPDIYTDFSFFVSHASGVFYISLEPWIRKLENELSEPQDEGAEFRLNRLLEAANTQVEHCLRFPTRNQAVKQEVTSCVAVAVADGDNTGYLVLTTVGNEPQAAFLDVPEDGVPTEEELAQYLTWTVPPSEMRQTYQPPKVLYESANLRSLIDQKIPSRHAACLKDEIRLSPANLQLLMEVHRVLAQHTRGLRDGVADLFRRCERLRDEFRDQVFRTAQLATKIESVLGNDDAQSPASEGSYGNAKIDERLEKVKARQEQINARYETIRRKVINVGGTALSDKETGWVEELQTMERTLDKTVQNLSDDADGSNMPVWERLEKIKEHKKTLAKEVEKMSKESRNERGPSNVKIPSQSRKQENDYIEALLNRETALVEAAADRLRSMGISIPVEGGS
ncbi:hypothetical protein K504DRAFT_468985 [Pleomassaria siparia CBS 279.74]|uniref:Uncharacterized protein n=1 Tax=Pleomassaria siparia CBS 279.74 TaxID=1314801 RepID=A0A6G1KQ77_9PLEO|nr:hypothetical protein K504DRAFT_468985 [Pleomassaria siparia CBS 279.74]